MLQGSVFNKVNSIGCLLKEFNFMCKIGDSYDITTGLFEEDDFNKIKLR